MGFRVAWSAEDGEWVATTEAAPSVSWLDTDPVAALAGLLRELTWMNETET